MPINYVIICLCLVVLWDLARAYHLSHGLRLVHEGFHFLTQVMLMILHHKVGGGGLISS